MTVPENIKSIKNTNMDNETTHEKNTMYKKYLNKNGDPVVYKYNMTEYLKTYKETHNLSETILCAMCGWHYKRYSAFRHQKCKHHQLAVELMNKMMVVSSSENSEEEQKEIKILDEM